MTWLIGVILFNQSIEVIELSGSIINPILWGFSTATHGNLSGFNMVYLYLGLAIIFEVVATSFLKLTEGFTQLWPSVVVVIGYGLAFYFLSLTIKTLPIGITYAIWAGLGIILVALIGMVFFKQMPDAAAWIGMGLIILGVVVIQVFSKTASH